MPISIEAADELAAAGALIAAVAAAVPIAIAVEVADIVMPLISIVAVPSDDMRISGYQM